MGVRGGSLSRSVDAADRFDWEAEGRRLGETLDDYGCLVVVGDDPTTTALAALGIARTQARRRRVALGDLFGDAPPIRGLLPDEDLHGLVDIILYGVSPNRVALPVDGGDEFFVLPTGTEAPDYEEILASPRWKRLSAGFREANALFLVVAPASAPGIEHLVASADGAIVVGDAVPAQLSIADILGSVREARPKATRVEPAFVDLAPAGHEIERPVMPRRRQTTKTRPLGVNAIERPIVVPAAERWGTRSTFAIVGSLVAVVLAVVSLWLALRTTSDGPPSVASSAADSNGRRTALTRAESTPGRMDSAAGSTARVGVPAPANPDDSTSAAAYAVILVNANTPRGAILRLQKDGSRLPAATFAPVSINGVTWFQLRAGAFATAAQADSLMRWLRRSGSSLDSVGGKVVRAPFAFLLDSAVQPAGVPGLLARYAQFDRPAYALQQRNGTARVYIGAFQTPEESMQLAEQLRAAGMDVPLVYRTGRVF